METPTKWPRVLRLSAERSAGAHPFNTTPPHTAQVREIIAPNALLLPERNMVRSTDSPALTPPP